MYILPEVGSFINRFSLKIGARLRFFKALLAGTVAGPHDTLDVVLNPNMGLYLVAHH